MQTKFLFFLLFALVTLEGVTMDVIEYTDPGLCNGCTRVNSDKHVHNILKDLMHKLEPDIEVMSVDSAVKQEGEGTKYEIEFGGKNVSEPNTILIDKNCKVLFYYRDRLPKKFTVTYFECTYRNAGPGDEGKPEEERKNSKPFTYFTAIEV